MEKIIQPDSWQFGDAIAMLIKMSSRGLVTGLDRRELIKRAGEEFLFNLGRGEMFDLDHQLPVHLLAMGSTEKYGCNRNGDGFKEAMLIRCHPTFVKYARPYRHHQNKDPDKSYGQVKCAVYHAPMSRVELLVLYNRTKEAAQRYGGLVADEEQQLLEAGKDVPFSMAARVPYDECSSCHNKAASRAEYCDENTCISPEGIKRGGCKHNLTKVGEDGHMLHVDNPDGVFFDISRVIRPADRIAYGGKADYLLKAASCELAGGAALAEAYGIVAPRDVVLGQITDPKIARQVKLAYLLADLEDRIQDEQWGELPRAVVPLKQPPGDISPLGQVGSIKLATGLSALAARQIVLPLPSFLALVTGQSCDKVAALSDDVSRHLPGIFNRLIASGGLEETLRDNPYLPSPALAPVSQRQWADKLAADLSLDLGSVRDRMALSAIRGNTCPALRDRQHCKQAESSEASVALARRYALYKLAFLSAQSTEVPLTCQLLVLQNYLR